jgi:pilus assembly protein CpaF
VLENTLSGDRRSVELPEKGDVLVGRPEPGAPPPSVPIRSPLVSRRQALLRRDGDGWTIEHLGTNDTRLGALTLELGKRYRLDAGAEIRIAEYALSLVEEAREQAAQEAAIRDREVMEFEADIHDRLLDRMNLRRGESKADPSDPETRRKIETVLDALLEEAIAGAPAALLEHILRLNIYRRLTWQITSSGSERGAVRQRIGYEQRVFAQMLDDVALRMGKECGLSFDPRRMQEDSVALDRSFDKVFQDHRLEFSEGLRKYVVTSATKQQIFDVIFGLGPLQDLMEMDSISEVMVVARDQIYIEKFGVIEDARRAFYSDELLLAVIERIVAPIGRRIDKSSPIVDAHLPDGSRVNAVIPPLALKGPCLTIRKFSRSPLAIEDLVRRNALSEAMVKFLRACVQCGMNVVVSGGTGSGKTTFLNGLSAFIPPKERIVTIEDTAELQLKQRHVVTLESRPANMEGRGAITIRDLVRNALRMRPDRIVVGECRGAEALDMLQAMNTGHDGSMTTAHANTPEDMMLRLETMVLTGSNMPTGAIREQIVSALDLVVQLTRFPDGTRCVTHVSEVAGIDEDRGTIVVEDIFLYLPPGGGRFAGGRFVHTGYIPSFIEDLLLKGAVSLEEFF